MNVFAWVAKALFWLLPWFRNGGTRINLEARSEASIQRAKREKAKLLKQTQELKDALDATTKRLVEVKAGRAVGDECSLDVNRRGLYIQYHRARQKYLNAGGQISDIR